MTAHLQMGRGWLSRPRRWCQVENGRYLTRSARLEIGKSQIGVRRFYDDAISVRLISYKSWTRRRSVSTEVENAGQCLYIKRRAHTRKRGDTTVGRRRTYSPPDTTDSHTVLQGSW